MVCVMAMWPEFVPMVPAAVHHRPWRVVLALKVGRRGRWPVTVVVWAFAVVVWAFAVMVWATAVVPAAVHHRPWRVVAALQGGRGRWALAMVAWAAMVVRTTSVIAGLAGRQTNSDSCHRARHSCKH